VSTRRVLARVALAAVAVFAARASAQGSLSVQGYGYPPGQLSTQARGLGGGIAEFDPLSPINPSSILSWGRPGLYFQYEPEFRRVSLAGRTDATTTARFPLVMGASNIGERGMIALGASTLLDRSSETLVTSGQQLGNDSVTFTERFRALGSITDLRLAGAWALSSRFAIGVAGHVYVGQNRLSVRREFPDTQEIGTLDETRDLSFTGSGVSAGLQWRPSRLFAIAASGRVGGGLRARSNDTTVAEGAAPDRFGAGIRWDGFGGVVLAARADWTAWSELAGLGRDSLVANDGWDIGGGAELNGPRLLGGQSQVRLGGYRRTLPFSAGGSEVRETAFSAGLGVPFAGGRAAFDFALQRAQRSASVATRERAWTLSIGLAVRP
jgi:hypothetical protein